MPIIKKPGVQLPKSSKEDRLMQIIIKGLLYESCLEYCQNRAISTSSDKVNFEFSNLLEETKLDRSDSSLLSWLQAIPADTFNFQFEDKKLNISIEKLDKPTLIATWTEILLTSPIKPRVFPHSATPFTRLKATDLMSKSLTSGIVDGLSKSIMSFSLKDAVDMSHSSIATTEFHLSQNNTPIATENRSETTNLLSTNKKNDEKLMETMFEHGNVFNSSLFGKLSTIEEVHQTDLNKESNKLSLINNNNLSSNFNNKTPSSNQPVPDLSKEMKIELEHFVEEKWKEFVRKKDELLMSSMTKEAINDLQRIQPINKFNESNKTPVNQTGQKFIDLQALITSTSTPKATPKDDQLELTTPVNATDYNPVRLNFSGISANSSSNTMASESHITQLAADNFDLNMSSPKNPLNNSRKFVNSSNQLRVSIFKLTKLYFKFL